MFCTKCGVANPDTAHFCLACGHAFNADIEVAPAATVYAGFWQRFAATFIDGFIVTLFSIPAFVIIALGASSSKSAQATTTLAGYIIIYAISAIYFSLMESGERSATYGKRWLGIKVHDLDGNRISGGRAFARWLSHFFSYVTLYIGFIMQPFTERKQALHDMISGTVVIDSGEKKNSAGVIIGVVVAFFVGIAVIGILAAIAIPAYQDYLTRAGTAEGLAQAEGASRLVEIYYLKTGNVPATLDEAGFTAVPSPSIAEIKVNPENAVISVLFAPTAGQTLAAKHLILTPSKEATGIIWKCSSADILPRNLPQSCRY